MKTIKLTDSEVEHLVHLINSNELEGVFNGYWLHYWKRSFRIKNKLINNPFYFCPACGTDHNNTDYFGFCCEECFNSFVNIKKIKW